MFTSKSNLFVLRRPKYPNHFVLKIRPGGFADYISEEELKDGYKKFIRTKSQKTIRDIAQRHNLDYDSLQSFVDNIITLMRFDDSKLTELLSPLGLGWKARTQKKLELMSDLIPELEKAAKGREISGLSVYDEK